MEKWYFIFDMDNIPKWLDIYEKIIYSWISSYSKQKKKFYYTNEKIADTLDISISKVKRVISSLENKKIIKKSVISLKKNWKYCWNLREIVIKKEKNNNIMINEEKINEIIKKYNLKRININEKLIIDKKYVKFIKEEFNINDKNKINEALILILLKEK